MFCLNHLHIWVVDDGLQKFPWATKFLVKVDGISLQYFSSIEIGSQALLHFCIFARTMELASFIGGFPGLPASTAYPFTLFLWMSRILHLLKMCKAVSVIVGIPGTYEVKESRR